MELFYFQVAIRQNIKGLGQSLQLAKDHRNKKGPQKIKSRTLQAKCDLKFKLTLIMQL